MAKGGVFCVEGQWHRDLNDQSSVYANGRTWRPDTKLRIPAQVTAV
ncbi:hypothetical protein GCM10027575_48680 [Phytohabitans suffuscus]